MGATLTVAKPSKVVLTYDTLDEEITKLGQKGHILYSRGWSVIRFNPTNLAKSDPKGVYINGRWGFEQVFEVRDDGTWEIELTSKQNSKRDR